MNVTKSLPLGQVAVANVSTAGYDVVSWGAQSLTHAQWVQQVQGWRAAFARVPGMEVALYFDDAVAFSAALWGAWHAGKTPVLVSDVQPYTLQALLSSVDACAGELPGAIKPFPLESFAEPPLESLDMALCKVVMFTSGSTGQPERIVKKLSQLNAEVLALQAAFGGDSSCEWQVLATVSHQHIYGLLFRILWPLSVRRSIGIRMFRFPEEVLHCIEQHRHAVLVSSPAFLSRLPNHLDWSAAREQLHLVFSSGGPLTADAAEASRQLLGCSPTEVFGSSETGGIAWRRRAEHGDTWQLLPGVQVRVQGDGLLAVRSAHLADASAWWISADCAQVSADESSFVLKGRVDRVVKIAEKRVSLTAIEQALHALPWVQQAKAVVLESADTLARIGVVIELTETGWAQLQQCGRLSMGKALRQHLSAYVERVALPRSWRYVTQMPVNSQSKITQEALRQLFNPSIPQPQWLERAEAKAIAQLYVDPSLRVLEGHFPQGTLVPGVAQLEWAVHCAQQAFGLQPRFVRAEVLKFQQPILPGDTVQLELNWDALGQRLQFALRSRRGPHASGKLVQEQS